MKSYAVYYEGTIREVYVVQAESFEHAREIWSDFEPVVSEVIDGEVVAVEVEVD